MTPARRNGLAILIVLLLGAGVASAFLVDEDDGTGETATGTAETSTTETTAPPTTVPPTTAAGPAPPAPTATSVAPATTTTAAVGGATTTTALTRQPRTGGPASLVPGLALAAAGLALLRVVNPRRSTHPD